MTSAEGASDKEIRVDCEKQKEPEKKKTTKSEKSEAAQASFFFFGLSNVSPTPGERDHPQ